jgi:hypothetical protein
VKHDIDIRRCEIEHKVADDQVGFAVSIQVGCSSSLTLNPMDFVRSGGFTMSRLPLSSSQPRLAAALKNQQVRLR